MVKNIQRYVNAFLLLMILLMLVGCGDITGSTSNRAVSGVPDPVQEETFGSTSFELDGYNVVMDYKYSYEISALVVSTRDYDGSDLSAKLVPKDLALAWGKVAEYNDRIDFHWKQSNRWYYWHTDASTDINVVGGTDGVNQHSANNHLIAYDDNIKEKIDKINAGDYIKLKGYLVNISANKSDGSNFWWNTSTSRTDTGDGACEVIYVISVEWLD